MSMFNYYFDIIDVYLFKLCVYIAYIHYNRFLVKSAFIRQIYFDLTLWYTELSEHLMSAGFHV